MRKKRKVQVRTNPTFAFVVDGDCEVWYLQMLKRNERSITVNIEPRIPQKKSLSEQFETLKDLAVEYTKVFWIVDLDVVLEETKKAKKGSKTALQSFSQYKGTLERDYSNVVVIVNTPCIEFWILLHFETTTKYFENCASAEKQLKKYLKDYEKTQNYYTKQDNDIYLRLKKLLNDAIANAKKTGSFNENEPRKGISEMHLFFKAKEFKEYFIKE